MKKIGFLSFGHWTPDPRSQTQSAADALLQSIDLAVEAERLGIDGAYFRLHHFAGLIAEGQSEPDIRQAFFDRWVGPRRPATIVDLERAKAAGELRSDAEPRLSERCDLRCDLLSLPTWLGPVNQKVRRGIGRASPPRASVGK